MVRNDLKPQPVREVGIEESAGMESIASFNHLSRLTILKVHSFEHVLHREVVINDIEMPECMSLVEDLLVYFGEVHGVLGRILSGSFVCVEPAETGTYLEAV